ncbi:MAG: hypothetical protein CMI54_04670 [Parcubacteria group bacterium]|nr:hypothetical protein [Parcubacteria group bacterium]
MSDILNCLFCESPHVEVVHDVDELSDYHFVRCQACGAHGPEGGTKLAAVVRWNNPKRGRPE